MDLVGIFTMLLILLIGIVVTVVFWLVIIKILHWTLGDTGCIVVIVIIGGPTIGLILYVIYKYFGY